MVSNRLRFLDVAHSVKLFIFLIFHCNSNTSIMSLPLCSWHFLVPLLGMCLSALQKWNSGRETSLTPIHLFKNIAYINLFFLRKIRNLLKRNYY